MPGALQMKSAETESGSASVVGMQRVSTMKCFPGRAVESIQGEIKKRTIGFAGTGVGRSEDMLEEGADTQAIENRRKPVVEIGNHCERAERGRCGKEVDGFGIESPGGWVRKMLEKGIKVILENFRIEGGGGVRGDGGKHLGNEVAPPGLLCSVSGAAVVVARGRGGGKDAPEGGLHVFRIEHKACGCSEVASINQSHRLNGVDQCEGGIKEDGHASECSVYCERTPEALHDKAS